MRWTTIAWLIPVQGGFAVGSSPERVADGPDTRSCSNKRGCACCKGVDLLQLSRAIQSHRRDKAFIERSKKRVDALHEEVSRAQLIVQETEAQLISEECPWRWRVPVANCRSMVRRRGKGRNTRLVADPLQEVALGDTFVKGHRSEQSWRFIKFDGNVDRQS